MKRALLDTNIIIHRETSRVINKYIGTLFFWLDKLGYAKYVHPVTAEELQRHTDKSVVRSMGIKLESYHVMKTTAPLHPDVDNVSNTIDTMLFKNYF